MNIHTGRKIDDWFGPLICLSLLAAKYLLSKIKVLNGAYKEKGQQDNMPKKILVIKFSLLSGLKIKMA